MRILLYSLIFLCAGVRAARAQNQKPLFDTALPLFVPHPAPQPSVNFRFPSDMLFIYVQDESGSSLDDASVTVFETRQVIVSGVLHYYTCLLPPDYQKLTLMINRPGYEPVKKVVDLTRKPLLPIVVKMSPRTERHFVAKSLIVPCKKTIF